MTLTSSATSGSNLTYRLDGGSSTAYAGPFSVSRNGQHSVTYRAIGGTGIASATDSLALKIDGTPPTWAIRSISATGVFRRYSIFVTDSDTGGSGLASKRLYYKRAGGTFRLYARSARRATKFAFKAPAAGSYSFHVLAVDVAGNVSRAPGAGSGPIVIATRLQVRALARLDRRNRQLAVRCTEPCGAVRS